MAKNRYYYYDEETFSFVELKPKRSKVIKKAAFLLVVSIALAGVISLGMDKVISTPQELSLLEENEALQQQLNLVKDRMIDFSDQLSSLAEHDQELYRTILQADPISEDIRMMGVGGNDTYEEFDRFSPTASDILKETSAQLDELERKVNLQNHSYRELSSLAGKRNDWLVQMPAILPVDGRITSGFGMRFHPLLRVRRMHAGIDFLVPTGTPVYATGDGVIKKTGQNAGFGKFVEIHHPATGYTTVYAHFSEIPKEIKKGKAVKRGELVGLSGNTGLSSAPHLHYEVRDKNRRAIDPVLFFLPSMTPEEYKELYSEAASNASSID